MEIIDAIFMSLVWWAFTLAIWAALWSESSLKSICCKHDYEEQYRAPSYERKEDVANWLENWVDIGYVCKKCKKPKTVSLTFKPISKRCQDEY